MHFLNPVKAKRALKKLQDEQEEEERRMAAHPSVGSAGTQEYVTSLGAHGIAEKKRDVDPLRGLSCSGKLPTRTEKIWTFAVRCV